MAQEIPDDSTILKLIYKKCDKGCTTSTKLIKGNKNNESATYKIIFKEIVKLKSKTILLVLTRAYLYANFEGHLGYIEEYSLKKVSGKWVLDYHPIYEQKELISISSPSLGQSFKVVSIGKDKVALIETFHKFKNPEHYDDIAIVSEITQTGLTELLRFSLGYARGSWNDEKCDGEYMTSTYRIVPNDQTFFEIKVVEKYYHVDENCKTIVDNKTQIIWSNTDSTYIMKSEKQIYPVKQVQKK